MFITEVLFALVVAFVLSLIFSMGFRGHGWGMGFLMFFIILFLMTWAGGIWVTPFGPLWWGVPWVSFLFVGLLIALVMTALLPKNHRYGTGSPSEQEAKATSETLIAMDVFFWVLMIAVVLLLIIGYATR